jgi:predicted nucleotidyltransferase component of viral defense system
MILKAEILAEAKRTGLQTHMIEKDYVLGWVLSGIFHHAALKEKWIFKGGPVIHRTYFLQNISVFMPLVIQTQQECILFTAIN